jgi:hypothetical protein
MSNPESLRDWLLQVTIAEVLRLYPESRPVLFDHFGASCFNCPAVTEESLELGIAVHRVDQTVFLDDLIHAILRSHRDQDSTPQGPPPEHKV